MENRFTVLQIIPRMRAGGAELGCLQVAEALVAAGHRALVASEGGRMVDALEAAGATHITLPLASKNPFVMWQNSKRLADIIRSERVDIIHARSRAPAWSALRAARVTGIRFVTTYHSEYSERGRIKRFYNGVMARADRVVSVSDNMRGLIQSRYGLPLERIPVIHRAFDPARFDPAAVTPERLDAIRAAIGVRPDDLIVLLPGRITRRKAQAHLIEAAGILKERGIENFVCVFAGEVEKQDYMAELDRRTRALGLTERVRFPGNVGDMAALYSLAAVSLNISEFEGLPRVALEAQAMGVPVIVSDTGPGREVALTAPDVSPEAATGLRVPFAEPPALAEALAELLGWPEPQRAAMGARAAAHVRSRYTLERLTRGYLAVYQEVLGRKG
ncbi:MAG TPA: glycosyltransferase family 4 protein [Hyphomicrobium sp.]|nr:glycosyltransferase family 4 protein [Hyphomicrobium sp.]HRO50013.1 glycosyltransferase family 4 protein [Hyphomicrobium sp.]